MLARGGRASRLKPLLPASDKTPLVIAEHHLRGLNPYGRRSATGMTAAGQARGVTVAGGRSTCTAR